MFGGRLFVELGNVALSPAGAGGYIAPMAQIYCTYGAVILSLSAQLYCSAAQSSGGGMGLDNDMCVMLA